ncbi:hypothetical protein JessAGP_018 [Caulobacter phage Jess A]|nr:hypothetical protein JessAGP_018 [Caulobacter phage Jess A]WCA46427.1 hypothetical protein [Caulobacter phage RapA]WCD56203.1 hypothetical protein [Caulobacter phage BL94]
MDHAERMMICGLALQGLLANPNTDTTNAEGNVRLAMRYANELGANIPNEMGEALATKAVRIAQISYEIRRQALNNAPSWSALHDDFKEMYHSAAVALLSSDEAGFMAIDLSHEARAILKCVVTAWE